VDGSGGGSTGGSAGGSDGRAGGGNIGGVLPRIPARFAPPGGAAAGVNRPMPLLPCNPRPAGATPAGGDSGLSSTLSDSQLSDAFSLSAHGWLSHDDGVDTSCLPDAFVAAVAAGFPVSCAGSTRDRGAGAGAGAASVPLPGTRIRGGWNIPVLRATTHHQRDGRTRQEEEVNGSRGWRYWKIIDSAI